MPHNLPKGLLDSLERLRLEYVDIVLIGNDKNRQCSIEEIVRACSFLIDRGWAFYWGTSNWSPQEIMEAHTAARLFHLTPPSLESIEFNMFERDSHEYGIPESCAKLGKMAEERDLLKLGTLFIIGLGLVTGAPLARGILSGKYINGIPEYSRASLPTQTKLRQHILSKEGQEQQAQVAQISQLAHRLGLSTSQLAIGTCAANFGAGVCVCWKCQLLIVLISCVLAFTQAPVQHQRGTHGNSTSRLSRANANEKRWFLRFLGSCDENKTCCI
ncbi:unnamed protein product [Schistocephalus solidus]|uniref:Aldo_ket_red domain-containing protein n=1 Tax=Schistocephalus solidus TaxID=70667 RepID=A0A183S7F4_SCHSO|nr:unnamed protein product [Schistocephalus solidus]